MHSAGACGRCTDRAAGRCRRQGAGQGPAHGIERGRLARLADRAGGQAFLHRRHVFFAGVLAHQQVVEHAPRNGCGMGRAKASGMLRGGRGG